MVGMEEIRVQMLYLLYGKNTVVIDELEERNMNSDKNLICTLGTASDELDQVKQVACNGICFFCDLLT